MNISAHIEFFKQEMKRRNYCDNTIKNYASCATHFFSKSKSDHPKNIHENEIRQYLNQFTEPNTQRSIHGAIKLYFEICLNQKDKFKYLPYAKKSRKLPIVLSQDEVQRIFNVCDNRKHRAIMALLYGCGLRVSEVINLKPEHIDSSRMIINVIQGKGKRDRQVMLPKELLSLLREYYKEYRPKEYLFNGQSEPRYSSRSINNFLKDYAQKAGVNKRIYAHLYRHCSFTHLVENGTDISLIQKLAGHSDVKTTLLYTHLSHNLISKIQSPLSQISL